ncbi:MAG: DNA-packaging protein [Ruminococcus sp.]|nr:DNA-packaging protein [Ruminococcus sp.]
MTFEEKKKREIEEMKSGKPAKRGSKSASTELHCKAPPEVLSGIIADIGHWFGSPKVKDDEDCRQRIIAFFEHYEQTGGIPTVEKLALALGTSPQSLWDWEVRRTKGGERAELIKAAKICISAIDADLALLGYIDKVVYIFRAKNYYGMKDTQDVVIQAKDPLGDGASREELERRLLEDTTEIEIEVDANEDT